MQVNVTNSAMKCCSRVAKGAFFSVFAVAFAAAVVAAIPSTLDGPFPPKTIQFDVSLRSGSKDLEPTNSRIVRSVKGNEPDQISLALSTPDAMWVTWTTGKAQLAKTVTPLDAKSVGRVVRYGTKSGALTLESSLGKSLLYSQIYNFPGLLNYSSGIIHHVHDTGLLPNTMYYYKCGDPATEIFREERSFTTLPLPGRESYPARVALVGDLGLTYNSTTTLDHIIQHDPQLLILAGDLSYANQYLTTGESAACYRCSFPTSPVRETHQPTWDRWCRFMQPLASRIPMMVIEGNHEVESQAGGLRFSAYESRFAVPSMESKSYSSFYYSFVAGGIHFVMLGGYVDYKRTGYTSTSGRKSTDRLFPYEMLIVYARSVLKGDFGVRLKAVWIGRTRLDWPRTIKTPFVRFGNLTMGFLEVWDHSWALASQPRLLARLILGPQYNWLLKDLASVDCQVTPWLVAVFHPPWYNSYRSHYREVECMRMEMEELLYMYGVDVVFSGHVHAYERMNRVYNYNLDRCGPVYVTIGDGGNIEQIDLAHADDKGQCPRLTDNLPDYGGICPFNFTSGPAAGKYCWDRQPEWSAFRDSSFGHGILEVMNSTYALWTWHRNQDMYGDPVGDQIYIVRQPELCLDINRANLMHGSGYPEPPVP